VAAASGKKGKKKVVQVEEPQEVEKDWRETMTVEDKRRENRKANREKIRNQNFMKTQ